eukprot:6214286-Pleurochrysis_carterae.AAC.2
MPPSPPLPSPPKILATKPTLLLTVLRLFIRHRVLGSWRLYTCATYCHSAHQVVLLLLTLLGFGLRLSMVMVITFCWNCDVESYIQSNDYGSQAQYLSEQEEPIDTSLYSDAGAHRESPRAFADGYVSGDALPPPTNHSPNLLVNNTVNLYVSITMGYTLALHV